jgi:hypothetical protein
MPRKPNYRFERMERDRAKASKKAERQKSKEEKGATRQDDTTDLPSPPETTEEATGETSEE